MNRPDPSLAPHDRRCRRAVSRLALGAITAILIAVSGGQAFAAGTATVSVRGAFSDGYGSYSVVVVDSRPGSKLVLYVNGGESQKVIVTQHNRAIFRHVELEGSGQLAFAKFGPGATGGIISRHFDTGGISRRPKGTSPSRRPNSSSQHPQSQNLSPLQRRSRPPPNRNVLMAHTPTPKATPFAGPRKVRPAPRQGRPRGAETERTALVSIEAVPALTTVASQNGWRSVSTDQTQAR
jgi:hypothetical protein